jgi:hypothetical protein
LRERAVGVSGDVDADDEFDDRPIGSSPSGWGIDRFPCRITGGGFGVGSVGACAMVGGVGEGRGMFRYDAISINVLPCIVR